MRPEEGGSDRRRQAGALRNAPFGARGARWGSEAAPGGEGRQAAVDRSLRVRALHAGPHPIPEAPSPGLRGGGGGSSSAPGRGSARPGRCPQGPPRPGDAGRFNTPRSSSRGGPPCTPRHAEGGCWDCQGGRTGDRGLGLPRGTRQVSPQLPTLRGGAPALLAVAVGGLGTSGRGPRGVTLGVPASLSAFHYPLGVDCEGRGRDLSKPSRTDGKQGRECSAQGDTSPQLCSLLNR